MSGTTFTDKIAYHRILESARVQMAKCMMIMTMTAVFILW
jgi:hypothetical protein